MICPKCGKVIPDYSNFCEHCGQQISSSQNGIPQMSQQNQSGNANQQGQPGWLSRKMASAGYGDGSWASIPSEKKRKLIWAGGIAAALCILVVVLGIVGIIFLFHHKNTIDLNDYAKVYFNGYDTMGTAEVDFDYEALLADLKDKAKIDTAKSSKRNSLRNLLENLEGEISDYGTYAEIYSDLDWSLDQSDKLSNGDTVTLSFTYDNDKAEEYGIRFAGDDQEIEVEGLEDVRILDAFENLKVEFSGVSPDVSASYENQSEEEALQDVYYDISPDDGIRAGDEVTVTVEYDEEELLEEYGCKIEKTSKKYTCKNVDEYITSLSDLNQDTLSSMQQQAKDVVNAYFASNSAYISKSEMKYYGSYFLAEKPTSSSWGAHNIIYVIYKSNVTSLDGSFGSRTVYFPVEFSDILRYADGTEYVDLNEDSIEGSTELTFDYWSHVPGYTSKEAMYNELVASQKVNYQGETSTEGSGKDTDSSKKEESNQGDGNSDSSSGNDDVKSDASSNSGSDKTASTVSQKGGYILPDADTRKYKASEIRKLSRHKLYLARNEIYARHGRKFETPELKKYFSKKSWYNPTRKEIPDSELNQYEKANIKMIKKYEAKKG